MPGNRPRPWPPRMPLGIVHRDLKPDNLYVVVDARSPTQEQIKVLDSALPS